MSTGNSLWFSFLTLCHLVIYTSAGIAYVHISNESITESRGCHLPQKVRVSVRVDNEILSLELTRNEDVNSNVPLFLLKDVNGGIIQTLVREQLADNEREVQFQDEKKDAAMTVSCYQNEKNTHLQLTGMLSLNGTEYKLEPKTRNRRDITRGEEEYILEKEPARTFVFDDLKGVFIKESLRHSSQTEEVLIRSTTESPDRSKRQTSEYYIDVLNVIDYAIYEKYFNQTDPGFNSSRRRILALQTIRVHFAYIMNGVNLRYKRLPLTFRIIVRLVGYVVADTPAKAPWTEKLVENNRLVNVLNVLKQFSVWVSVTPLPSNDHAMLFTGYNVYTLDGNVKAESTVGLAYVGTMCMSEGKSVSVIEDNGSFDRIDIATHELGHSLGASHDGDGNLCKSEDRYIMSSGTFRVTNSNQLNPWIFSTCSVTYFRNFITSLLRTRYGMDCLTKKITAENVPNVPDTIGQLFDPDAQCRNIYGPKSRLCRTLTFRKNTSDICRAMFCLVNATKSSIVCSPYEAARATTCGNKKWCINGQCVYSPDAPSADEDCLFGNENGIVYDGQTCDDFIASSNGYYCYQSTVRIRCCQSCRKYYTGVQACLYGDKLLGCQKEGCGKLDNKGVPYNTYCCGTCGVAKPIDSSTKPPVTTSTAKTNTSKGVCSDVPGISIQGLTCKQLIAASPSYCYLDMFKIYCCGTCASVSRGIPGCEFGDKNRKCNVTYCDNVSSGGLRYDDICCDTCNTTTTRATPTRSGAVPTHTTSFFTIITKLLTTTIPATHAITTTTTTTTTPTTTAATTSTTTEAHTLGTSPTSKTFSCVDVDSIDGETCSEFVDIEGKTICYNTTVKNACCAKCSSLASGIEGCEFGDRNPTMCAALKSRENGCQGKTTTCCSTCKQTSGSSVLHATRFTVLTVLLTYVFHFYFI